MSEGEKGIDQADVRLPELLHVVSDHFRIGHDNWAIVMVIGRRAFLFLIGNVRIKNRFYTLLDQVDNMAMSQLGRITDAFRRNGIHALFKHFIIGMPG